MSGIVNKIKEAVHSGENKPQNKTTEGTYGPHSGATANTMDPRVDSDRDGSLNMGATRTAGHGEYGSSNPFSSSTTGTGNTYGTSGMTGQQDYSSGTGNAFSSSGAPEGTHGPHSSRLANAADPRVDSDRDGSRTIGSGRNTDNLGSSNAYGTQGTQEFGSNTYGSRNTEGLGSNTYGSQNTEAFGSSTYGTQTGASGYGAGSGATGMTGTHGDRTGTHGPHSSRMANAADPRADSDRDGRGALHHGGPGPAPNTAGPHKSDMLNKMDPRVDSDLDGSKTLGGNQTYQ